MFNLNRFGYIRCDTTVSVLMEDFSGCDLFRMLRLPKQSVHHSLPPLRKCSYLTDRGQPRKLPDLWPPNSHDINPTVYKNLGHSNETTRQMRRV